MDKVVGIVFDILLALLNLLPSSPFIVMASQIEEFEFLGFLNYFIPFDNCLTLLTSWLVCVGIYYVVKYMRQIVDFIKGFLG